VVEPQNGNRAVEFERAVLELHRFLFSVNRVVHAAVNQFSVGRIFDFWDALVHAWSTIRASTKYGNAS
jgi:hypothetical protein